MWNQTRSNTVLQCKKKQTNFHMNAVMVEVYFPIPSTVVDWGIPPGSLETVAEAMPFALSAKQQRNLHKIRLGAQKCHPRHGLWIHQLRVEVLTHHIQGKQKCPMKSWSWPPLMANHTRGLAQKTLGQSVWGKWCGVALSRQFLDSRLHDHAPFRNEVKLSIVSNSWGCSLFQR